MATEFDELAKILKDKFGLDMERVLRDTHANTAIRIASLVGESLADSIKAKLRADGKTVSESMFKDRGKYASLKQRIDGAHNLTLIDDTTHKDAHLMRLVRNEFGHLKATFHFDSDEVVKYLSQMSTYEAAEHNQDAYLQVSSSVIAQLQNAVKARLKQAGVEVQG